jgi:hypothetical protein
MAILFESEDNNASVVYDEGTLTLEQQLGGWIILELPQIEMIEGKQAILKANVTTEEVWWEYVDEPIAEVVDARLPLEVEVDNLKELIADLTQLVLLGGDEA